MGMGTPLAVDVTSGSKLLNNRKWSNSTWRPNRERLACASPPLYPARSLLLDIYIRHNRVAGTQQMIVIFTFVQVNTNRNPLYDLYVVTCRILWGKQ